MKNAAAAAIKIAIVITKIGTQRGNPSLSTGGAIGTGCVIGRPASWIS